MNRFLAAPICSAVLAWSPVVPTLPLSPSAQPGPSPGAVWPLQPRPEVVRGFEPPVTPWGVGHRGVDLRGLPRQVVQAAQGGRVSFVGMIAGVAVVVVDHGATRMTYEPVDATVGPGARITSGEPIGRLSLFGSHCWPAWCLHWGLISGQAHYLDPLSVFGLPQIRLLPLSWPVEPGWVSDSGARMRLGVDPPESIGGDVGVDLRGRE